MYFANVFLPSLQLKFSWFETLFMKEKAFGKKKPYALTMYTYTSQAEFNNV